MLQNDYIRILHSQSFEGESSSSGSTQSSEYDL